MVATGKTNNRKNSMIIERVMNNNVISTFDQDSEIVICGSGIGFGKHAGDPVDESKIEKIYRIENKERLGKFKDLLVKVPMECLRISDEIITLAKKEMDIELNENIYITLTDHITFALERYKQGMDFENALTQEVHSFYPKEFHIGLEAVSIIEDITGIALKEDEAASIALHIVSAELSAKTSVAYEITQTVKQILSIVEKKLGGVTAEKKELIEDMIPTFKHFVFRVISRHQYQDNDRELFSFVQGRYRKEFECCEAITDYVSMRFQQNITIDEKSYIIIMLRKLNF